MFKRLISSTGLLRLASRNLVAAPRMRFGEAFLTEKAKFEKPEGTPGYYTMYNFQFDQLIRDVKNNSDEFVILDIRESEEIEKCDIPGLEKITPYLKKVNLTMFELYHTENHILDQILDKEKTIICLCRAGVRAQQANWILTKKGFNAITLFGGMIALADVMPQIPKEAVALKRKTFSNKIQKK
eukprot:TRINITY_DN9551_c0_g1_i1.p1 TRINITY_DN9551_c0_g1~~TRINITY_DN9551_c0_g1_i1.p1  ORF type:complete len:184 (+),score=49.04 TRINITY_DN9551_c0_g1_i1:79-630(+)